MRYPAIFVNHGGGPMPLLGRQPNLVQHMKDVVATILPTEKPKNIVVISAHWESDPIRITSASHPAMLYDYYGFPPETYQYQYPAPGNPLLATKIQSLLTEHGLKSELDDQRGYDHGVFIPLMIMYPEANIPVVCVSLHSSLDPKVHMQMGQALQPLRDEGTLILGSGYTFHNLPAFFNPSHTTYGASDQFNNWLKKTLTGDLHKGSDGRTSMKDRLQELEKWSQAPGARVAHPREEHLIPLLVTAGTATATSSIPTPIEAEVDDVPELIFNVPVQKGDHAVSGYLFR
jgi:4,5-DOPA dioxygenase extradiol